MKKKNRIAGFLLITVLCLALAGGVSFLVMRAVRIHKENQQMDEEFSKELEESRRTIDRMKEQEAEIETGISASVENQKLLEEEAQAVEETLQDNSEDEDEDDSAQAEAEPAPLPDTPLVSLSECSAGEILPEEILYLDNPGIYFAASYISEGGGTYQRLMENLPQEQKEEVNLEQVRYLKMPFYNSDGQIQVGEMAVSSEISQEVLDTFQTLFEEKEQISSMEFEDNCWLGEDAWDRLCESYHLNSADDAQKDDTQADDEDAEAVFSVEE